MPACSGFLSPSDFVAFICTMIIGKSVDLSSIMAVAPLLFTFERRGKGGARGGVNSADDVRRASTCVELSMC